MKRPEGRAAVVLVLVALLIALPMLYILSSGPAILLVDTGLVPMAVVRVVYAPIGWLEHNSPACREFIQWYVGLWSPGR